MRTLLHIYMDRQPLTPGLCTLEGPDLGAATCSLRDASLTWFPQDKGTAPRFLPMPMPTGILTISCLYGPKANQVVLWMLALAKSHPQCATQTPRK